MNLRLRKLRLRLQKENLDGLIVSSPANISYLTESLSRDAYLLTCVKAAVYFTDSRYREEAGCALKDKVELKEVRGGLIFREIVKGCLDLGLKRVAFESRHLPFAEYHKLKEYAAGRLELIPSHSLVESFRVTKEPGEIKKLREAARIAGEAMAFAPGILSIGRKEIEVAGDLERFIRYSGGRCSSFDIIVACGANSSRPHHLSGRDKIKDNSLVLIDLGVEYEGYKSDLTRVFFLGKIKSLMRRIYKIVLRAQERAIREIKPGAEIRRIDASARSLIARNGYGGRFKHSLGHGVGLEVHEEPHINPENNLSLKPGMVFTVEPGIYLSGGFGVRIEDMVLVTGKGCEVLSGSVHK